MSRDTSTARFPIAGRTIGTHRPLYVIAEIGLNHGGSIDRALALVDAMSATGAAAVKLQTLFADDLVATSCPAPMHVRSASLRDFFRTFELDEDAHRSIARRAHERGLAFMATPFSLEAVDLLVRVGADAIKIASGDLTWDGLIACAAATGKPLVMSTGMSGFDEVTHALGVARQAGARDLALLHCVSAYPVPRGHENLRAIASLRQAFDVPVGLSDHGDDTFAAPLAVALGASLYERHVLLSHDDGSVDDAVSSTPAALADLVRAAERARLSLGSGEKTCLPAEAPNRSASRRGLYVARAQPIGHTLTADDLVALRPLHAVAASRLSDFVGRTVVRALHVGAPLCEADVDRTRDVHPGRRDRAA